MPVVAVVGAIGAMAMGGASAIGAVIAGTATLAETLTAVAAVGATLGAVGAVTHDKTLTTVGMVMGGIGGVGALAANAGLLGASATTESLFGSSASAGAESVTVTPEAAWATGGISAPMQAAANSANADIINSIGKLDTSSIGMPSLPGLDGTTSALDPISNLPMNNLADTAAKPAAGAAPLPTGLDKGLISARLNPTPSGVTFPQASVTGAPITPSAPGVPDVSAPSVPGDEPGFFSKLMSNPYAQYGMIQAGGSLISGMFDPLKPAQVSALDAQSAANRAAATLAQTQATNMSQPIPVASRGSLINSKPVTSPAVTGKAAA